MAKKKPLTRNQKIAFVMAVITVILTSIKVFWPAKPGDTNEQTVKPVTKQEIRTFLESVDENILRAIDSEIKKFDVRLKTIEQVKLNELSEHPDFKKYLTFEDTGEIGFGKAGTSVKYILYPKDALIK